MKTKSKILIAILSLITVAAIGTTVWAVFFRDTTPVLTPDYAPQKQEENAEPIGDESDEKLDSPKGGGAVSLTYSTEVTVTLDTKEAALLFGNPSKSNQDMVLQIVIDDVIIAQSGTLKPGYQVEKLALLETAKLAAGGYNGKFNILYYNQENGERAILNTEIPVTITVT